MIVVGVDLGGTKTAAGVVDASGRAGELLSRPTPASAGPDAVLDAVAALVGEVLERAARGSEGARLGGVGVGSAGVLDAVSGCVLSATDSMPGWAGTDVAGGLRERLADRGVPPPALTVRNDVDAHARGETWVGAGAGASSAVVVAVGTGIGGSIVTDGRVWSGAHSVAGEIGHVPVPGAEHLRCACGRMGHVEAIGAGPGLLRHYLSLGGDTGTADARAVVGRAANGDALARRAVEESASAVGRMVAGLVTTLDPEVVVVAGGLAGAGEQWWTPMEQAARGELIGVLREVPLRPAMLGAGAAVVGAARDVWEAV
ncbi:ROK family protein [Beutenbergia cavernae DSM 12333]|uniref:ROK family protein n=1 Tax=Beutenbergia cavernae (strain ATCC BAA-8 / DSM 12333 / CCUG 43141 / JCM 11478 / NBRC 16432 / NCIMB 13614 / HKI 0122) TaxID=471853 RepID=C5C3V3_BEUC1|nr:ROK family protein [Beutenbergia cavernae]ACQ82012.1 ROK family protein [Beutenbergia cavernae DSM 12333]